MSKDAFALQYQDVATRAGEQLGVDPQALLAQWGLETGWGKSVIPGTNNLGNIKDFSGKGVEAVDNMTKSRDKYRAYDTVDAFADDYVSLIKKRYPSAVGQKTVQGFAQALKDGGYAEDPEYVSKLTKLAGAEYTPTAAPQSPKQKYDAILSEAVQNTIVRPTSRSKFDSGLEAEAFNTRIREEARPTGFEQFGAAVAGATDSRIFGGIVDRLWGPEFEPVEGYAPDLKALPLYADSELIADYAGATSPEAAAKVLKAAEDEAARTAAVMDDGLLTGLALSIAAEGTSVTNWVAPFAAAKSLNAVGKGSLALAQQGRAGASLGSSVVENLVSGTVVEAVAQGMTGRLNGQDLLVSLAADSLLGLGSGAAGLRAVRSAESVVDRAAISAVAQEADYADRALKQLGEGASSGELRKAMDRLYAEDLSNAVKDPIANIPVERQLIKDAPMQQDLQTSTRFAAENNAADEQVISTMNKRWGELRELGLDLPDTADGATRIAAIDALDATPKVHITSGAKNNLKFAQYAEALESLRKQFIPDVAIHITDGKARLQGSNLGVHAIVKPNVSVLGLRTDSGMATAVHEFGHAVFAHRLAALPADRKAAMEDAWRVWQEKYMTPGKAQEAALQRSPVGTAARRLPNGDETFAGKAAQGNFKQAFADVWDDAFPGDQKKADAYARYYGNFDEYSAEQFAKFVEAEVAGVGQGKLTVPQQILQALSYLLQQAAEIFKFAKAKNLVRADEPFEQFFNDLLAGNVQRGVPSLDVGEMQAMAVPAKPAAVVSEVMTDPATAKFGLTIVPVGTAAERKHAQAMLALHKQAAEWEAKNPMNAEWNARVQNLADNNVFNVASTGLLMLKSPSPLVRMIASELLEDASGAAGKRQATAAISKYMTERFMLGNAINDVQGAYTFWKKGKPGGLKDDLIGGRNWAAFNKEVAAEIEARRLAKAPVSQDPNIKAAADTLEAAYQRTANAQRSVNTLGSEGLPESSVGYMPHRMSPKAVINMTNEQGQILHDALVDQFVTIEGWDASFSDQLASTYMKRVRDKASGDYGSNVGGANPGTNSLVEEALRAMDLPEDTIQKHMEKFNKGGANFTKGRIELDLNKVYALGDGSEFKLLGIFETNQLELLRSQAGRASGEVALTKFGVRGKPGLKLLRDAMAYGEDGKKAGVAEKEAFDQMAAEFMNEPFGTQSGKFMERAMAANTLVRLGGIAFNQIAESINGIFHVGAARTMASVASIPRLRQEIKALAAGQKVDNPFLSSIELAGGAEFGTDAYKIVMPFDSPDHAYPTYGQDTLTVTDRLLRGGGYLQGKLSGWRLIHSAQQRGMAEQIVHKMMRFVREGNDDVALRQFGIDPNIQAALKADLTKIATFDSAGNLTSFDVTKITDPDIREQVIQSVWRGTSQIIQGTFIGERGKWAHDGWLKMMTQFRSFSITSMEKQWGRQRNSRGNYAAFGMMLGAMSIAAPIYMARTYAASVGRPDQEEFLEQRLQPEAIARATLNYIAMSGMAGDFIDLTSSLLPEELGITPTGGRSGVETDFVGNYVLPASSLVNDIWKYAQSPLEADDAAKILPMSRLPYLLPLTNATRD